MKANVKNNLIAFILYFIAALSVIVYFIVVIGQERHLTDSDGLRLAAVIQDKASKRDLSLSIWGPISFVEDGSTCHISLQAANLLNNWAEGSVSLIEAKNFENEDGTIKTADEIKAVLNKKNNDGKAIILEKYSFDFNFSRYKGISDGYAWEESDLSIEKYFDLEKSGSYYLLLEYYSEAKFSKHYSAKNFHFQVTEKAIDGGCFVMAFFLLFLLAAVYFVRLLFSIFSKQEK